MTNLTGSTERKSSIRRAGEVFTATSAAIALAIGLAACSSAEASNTEPTHKDPKATSEVATPTPSETAAPSSEIMSADIPGTKLIERPKAGDIDPSLQKEFIEADNLARTDYREFVKLPEATKLMWRSAYEDEVTHSIVTTMRQAKDPVFELNKNPQVGDTGASVISTYVRAGEARYIGFKNFDDHILDGNQQVSDVNMDLSYFSTAFLLDKDNPGYTAVNGRFNKFADLASYTYTDPTTGEDHPILLKDNPAYSITPELSEDMLANAIKDSATVEKKVIDGKAYDTVETVVTTTETYRYVSILVPYKDAKTGKDANQWVVAYINDF
jgi:hypothetical protein